jgi:SpoIID/LytB domain protein
MQGIRYNGNKVLACLLAFCVLISFHPIAYAADTLVSAPLIVRKDSSNGMVRVYLSSLGNPGTLNITISGSYTVNGVSSQQLTNGSPVTVDFNSNTGQLTLTANGTTKSMGSTFKLRRHSLSGANGLKILQARSSGNLYPGDLTFVSVPAGSAYKLYTIAYIFIEDYLYGVLPYEMGSSAPGEALKAQAVTARTYTLRAMASAGSRLYDVVDTTSDQVYSGTPSGGSACKAAVDATRGIVSKIGGSFTATYYTASNGGQVESARNLWGSSAYDYIIVKDDPYDFSNPDSRVRTYAVSGGPVQNPVLAQLLQAKAKTVFGTSDVTVTAVRNIVPHTPKYSAPSRLYTKIDFYVDVTAGGLNKAGVLPFNIFTELETPLAMGINTSANELWTVIRTDSGFSLKARRYGHGTGLSQRGAMYMAKLGYTYAQILAFYFEGCSRVQYTLISSILSPVVDGADSIEVSATQTPAELTDVEPCTAIVSLSSGSAQTALRSTAQDNGSIITMLKQGAEVTVYTVADNWCLVKYGVLCGYLKKPYLVISGTPSGNNAAVTNLSGYGVVSGTGSLNLRRNQSMSAEVLSQIPRGAILPLISLSSDWAYTQYDRLAGYVYLNLLTQYSRYPVSVNDSSPGAMVSSAIGKAALRMTPSSTSYVISQLVNGTLVSVKYDDGSWCCVLHGGVTGYILSGDLTYTDEPVDESEDMIGAGEYAATANPASSALNLRLTASSTAEVIAEIPKGDSLIVTHNGTIWSAVRYRGVPGFVMTQYILFTPVSDVPAAYARVNTVSGSLNLRASASSTAAVLITIPQGTVIPVYEKGSQWCRAGYNGRTGYVMTNYLVFISDSTAPPTPSPTPAALPTPSPTPVITVTPTATPVDVVRTARVDTLSGSLNLREAANAYARVLTTIPQNTIIEILSKGSVWSKVKYNGYIGYSMTKFLVFTTPATAAPAPTGTPQALPVWMQEGVTAKVNTVSGSLNLRASPSSIARVIITIPKGAIVTVITVGTPWCKVTYAAYSGYVMTSFLASAEKNGVIIPYSTPLYASNPLSTVAAGN